MGYGSIFEIVLAEVMKIKEITADKKVTYGEIWEAVDVALDKADLKDKVALDLEKVKTDK